MAYAVLNLKKHKTVQRLGAVSKHNERTRETRNADPARTHMNERLVGSGDLCADVQARMNEAGINKVRANGVRAVEFYTTASPEWFREASPEDVRKWVDAELKWAKTEFGDNLVSVHLHMDEHTPNIHTVMVPITPDGRLAATRFFGKPQQIRDLHTRHSQAVEHLDLERPVLGSKATHRQIDDYYAAIEQTSKDAWTLARATTIAPVRPGTTLEDRVAEAIAPTLTAERLRSEYYRDRAKSMSQQLEGAKQRGMQHDYTREQYGELINNVRGTDLVEVMQGLGATPDDHDRHVWNIDNKKINIRGDKFYDFHAREGDPTSKGGGAIDLVRYATGRTLKEAVAYLNDRHYGGRALSTVRLKPSTYVQEPQGPTTLPTNHAAQWPEVRRYLIEERKLPADLVDSAHERGDIYATEYKGYPNAVFVRRDESGQAVGAFTRGTRGDFRQSTKRDQGASFGIEFGTPNRIEKPSLVLVESPIDAISYAALHREGLRYGRVISTDGRGPLPTAEIDRTLQTEGKIRAAFDNDGPDGGGSRLWNDVQTRYPQQTSGSYTPITRESPKGKDWNEDLQQIVAHRERSTKGPSMGR